MIIIVVELFGLISGFRNSRLFENVPDDVLSYLIKESVTQNEHQYGMVPEVSKEVWEILLIIN